METVLIVMQQAHQNVPNVQLISTSILPLMYAVPVQLKSSQAQLMYAPIVMQSVSLAHQLVQTS